MKKKSVTLLLAGAVLTAVLTGCGASGKNTTGAGTSESTPTDASADDTGASEGRTSKAYKPNISSIVGRR